MQEIDMNAPLNNEMLSTLGTQIMQALAYADVTAQQLAVKANPDKLTPMMQAALGGFRFHLEDANNRLQNVLALCAQKTQENTDAAVDSAADKAFGKKSE